MRPPRKTSSRTPPRTSAPSSRSGSAAAKPPGGRSRPAPTKNAGRPVEQDWEARPKKKRPRKPKPVPGPEWAQSVSRASAPKSAVPPEPPKEDRVLTGIFDALEGGKSLSPMEVARHIAESMRRPTDGPDLWRRYLTAVKQQMVHLAREGRIEIVRKGAVVDPEDFKGVVRIRLPRSGD